MKICSLCQEFIEEDEKALFYCGANAHPNCADADDELRSMIEEYDDYMYPPELEYLW